MIRANQPLELGPWMGLYQRGDLPPQNHMNTCTDSMFYGDQIYPRPLFEQIRTLGLPPLRAFPFKLSTNPIGSRWLVLVFDSGIGLPKVFDVTVGGPSTLVFTCGTNQVIDMSVLVAYDRAYITFHDRVRAIPTQSVVVWDPVLMSPGPGRLAAGFKPTGTFTVGTSVTAGNVEAGLHVYAVANEFDTGHVTPPNLYVSLTAPGGKCTDLTVIPLGPTGVVARWILMSRVVQNPPANIEQVKLFFALRVPDNSTTTLTGTNAINLFDSQLQTDADYLKDLYEAIPSGVAIALYSNRLILGNVNIPAAPLVPPGPILPPKAEHSLLLGSRPGFLESISKTDGLRQVTKSEGGGIKQISEVNGIMYARKSFMTFALQDNGDEFTRWPVNQLDVALGTEPFGIATFPGTSSGATKGRQVMADRSGLYLFDGQYSERPLTWKVHEIWRTIDPARFSEIMVTIDPERNRMAVLLPPHSYAGVPVTSKSRVLYADFDQGLDPDNIRWSYWTDIDRSNTTDEAVGFGFDYRDSLAPSLTTAMTGAVNQIMALANDLVVTPTRGTGYWEIAVPMHPKGGLGHFESIRLRLARIGSDEGLMQVTVGKVASNSGETDPNVITKDVDITAQAVSFYNFKNLHLPFNRSNVEVAWVRFDGVNSIAMGRAWVSIVPDTEEKIT